MLQNLCIPNNDRAVVFLYGLLDKLSFQIHTKAQINLSKKHLRLPMGKKALLKTFAHPMGKKALQVNFPSI